MSKADATRWHPRHSRGPRMVAHDGAPAIGVGRLGTDHPAWPGCALSERPVGPESSQDIHNRRSRAWAPRSRTR